jgi:predicted nucleic acid-binding protein
VRFWDTSAVVPLLVTESATPTVRRLLDEDPGMVVWWATRTECVSALARRRREGPISSPGEQRARRVLRTLGESWAEVLPSETLRGRAERLLGVHMLRSADAFQLASALVWSRGETSERVFVSLDERLRDACRREGFLVLPT